MRNLMSTLGIAILIITGAPAMAAEKTTESETLQAMSASARTTAEHATVARHYRLAAETFEAKAVKHEAEANRLRSRPMLGLAGKWPAMMPRSEEKERALAMQARRAAQESLQLADRHYRFAVETQHAE